MNFLKKLIFSVITVLSMANISMPRVCSMESNPFPQNQKVIIIFDNTTELNVLYDDLNYNVKELSRYLPQKNIIIVSGAVLYFWIKENTEKYQSDIFDKYNIFKAQGTNEFLLIPKAIDFTKLFNSDSLEIYNQSSPEDLMQQIKENFIKRENINWEKLKEVFKKNTGRWIFIITGHGSPTDEALKGFPYPHDDDHSAIAALEIGQFLDLLTFIGTDLSTKLITVLTCYGGGYHTYIMMKHIKKLCSRPDFKPYTLFIQGLTDTTTKYNDQPLSFNRKKELVQFLKEKNVKPDYLPCFDVNDYWVMYNPKKQSFEILGDEYLVISTSSNQITLTSQRGLVLINPNKKGTITINPEQYFPIFISSSPFSKIIHNLLQITINGSLEKFFEESFFSLNEKKYPTYLIQNLQGLNYANSGLTTDDNEEDEGKIKLTNVIIQKNSDNAETILAQIKEKYFKAIVSKEALLTVTKTKILQAASKMVELIDSIIRSLDVSNIVQIFVQIIEQNTELIDPIHNSTQTTIFNPSDSLQKLTYAFNLCVPYSLGDDNNPANFNQGIEILKEIKTKLETISQERKIGKFIPISKEEYDAEFAQIQRQLEQQQVC